MEIDFASVSDNYMALPEEEKNIVRKGMSGPMGTIIGKIFGSEFMEAVGTFSEKNACTNWLLTSSFLTCIYTGTNKFTNLARSGT